MQRLFLILLTATVLVLAVSGGVMASSEVMHHDMDAGTMQDCMQGECPSPMAKACALHCLFAAQNVDAGLDLLLPSFTVIIALATGFFFFQTLHRAPILARVPLRPYRDPWATLTTIKRE